MSHGAKASTKLCIPGLPACACGPRIGTTGARSPIPTNGCSSNGRKAKARRPNIGSRPCRPIPTSRRSLQPPKCAGGSNATIRNSSRNSASITMKDEAGETSPPHGALRRSWFLVSERSLIPHSGDNKTRLFQKPRLSPGYRPRGSPDPTRTPHQSVQSQPSALSSPAASPDGCRDVLVVNEPTYDTVRLWGCGQNTGGEGRAGRGNETESQTLRGVVSQAHTFLYRLAAGFP